MELKLAIVGAGAIGRAVARACAAGECGCVVVAITDPSAGAMEALRTDFAPHAAMLPLVEACAIADVVLEAAAKAAVPAVLDAARASRAVLGASHAAYGHPHHVVVMSVGGLLDCEPDAAGPVVHVPSGALGGLDALQALALAGLDEVRLTTRKPPRGLGLDVAVETVVFEGSAREAIALFPANVNVAVALSFAGIGPDRTQVRVIADPVLDRNTHTVYARGPAGEIEFTSRNVPFPENLKTSWLAALSAIATLRKLSAQLRVG
jgi:aspartate dehydrogenase